MFKINDVIRMSRPVMQSTRVVTMVETHVIARVNLPATADHPDPLKRPYAPMLRCGIPADASRMVPWSQPDAGAEITCEGCAGPGPATGEQPDAQLDAIMNGPATGAGGVPWLAGRKGNGKRMHGIPDRADWQSRPVTSGRGKNKITRLVVEWRAACGTLVGGWDSEANVPVAPSESEDAVPVMVPGSDPVATGEPNITRYAPHATEWGASGGVQWCGNCAGVFKALRGPVAPKGVLTSKAAENVAAHGEATDRQERANARAAWLGQVLPRVRLTLGDHGAPDVHAGDLVVVGKGGPVHAGALDGEARMMLVCRTGVMRGGWKRPKEGRETVTCVPCRIALYGAKDSMIIPQAVLDVITRPATLPDAVRFASVDSGSNLSDHSAETETILSTETSVRLTESDRAERRFPYEVPPPGFRGGSTGRFRVGLDAEERKERKALERADSRQTMNRAWNTLGPFRPTHRDASGGRTMRTMIISRGTAERLRGMFDGPAGMGRVSGWDYVKAMGALPASVKATLNKEERARLYGGGAALAARRKATRDARRKGAALIETVDVKARRLAGKRENPADRAEDMLRRDRSAVYGSGRDFSDRVASSIVGAR